MPSARDATPSGPTPKETSSTAGGSLVADERSALEARYNDMLARFEAATEDAYSKFLAQFADTFAVLHDVVLDALPVSEVVPELDELHPEVRESAAALVEGLVAGGETREIAVSLLRGAVSVSTSAQFTSLVGKSMSSNLPRTITSRVSAQWNKGLAAIPGLGLKSKTFLRDTGEALARNRRNVLITVAGVTALALIAGAVRADKRDRDAKLAEVRQRQLDDARAERAQLVDGLTADQLLVASERTEQAIQTLEPLLDLGITRLPDLQELVAKSDDYTTYSSADRRLVAELTALAETVAGVIAATWLVHTFQKPESAEAQTGALQAANHVVNRYSGLRNPGADAAPAISAAAAFASTTNQRNQLSFLLNEREYIHILAQRCQNLLTGSRDGFFFEALHSMSFNLDAIGRDADLRADMTERLDRPHDPVDIVIRTPNGDVRRQVQAKVVDRKSQRVAFKNGLSDPKYASMDLLLPADHLEPTNRYLDRPEGNIFRERYAEVLTRTTDRISIDGISSDPITTGELTKAAEDPQAYLHRLTQDNRVTQAKAAAVAAGGTATLISLTTDTARHILEGGHLNDHNWAQAAVAAARTGVASAVAGAASNYAQTGAHVALADGSNGRIHSSLARGDHGPALTQATINIAVIAQGLIQGDLDANEAAAAAAETIAQATVNWAVTAVARNTIPDPALAALVGGIVGQYGGQLLTYGIRVAILARNPGTAWDDAYNALIEDTIALQEACARERAELAALAERYRTGFTEHVLPALDRISSSRSDDPEGTLQNLAAIANHFTDTPLFDTVEAFDGFMADHTTPLRLRLLPNQS